MSQITKTLVLAAFGVGIGIGCGRKPDVPPDATAENRPEPAEKVAPALTPAPAPAPTPKAKPTPRPKPKTEPTAKQPDVIFGAYNEFNAKNQLRNIFFALASYELTHKHYPAGIVGPDGNLGLSWRVAILPYTDDAGAKLYKEFNLAEAWDSSHNKALLTRMPSVFATPGTAAAGGRTYYRTFAGPKAFIPSPATAPAGQPARGRARTTITDGDANTLAVVQATEPVEWTKPDDLTLTDEAVPPLGLHRKGFLGLMCDGAVHTFPETITDKSLRALITASAGDVPGPDAGIRITPPNK